MTACLLRREQQRLLALVYPATETFKRLRRPGHAAHWAGPGSGPHRGARGEPDSVHMTPPFPPPTETNKEICHVFYLVKPLKMCLCLQGKTGLQQTGPATLGAEPCCSAGGFAAARTNSSSSSLLRSPDLTHRANGVGSPSGCACWSSSCAGQAASTALGARGRPIADTRIQGEP